MKIKKYLSVFLCALFLLGLTGLFLPEAHAADYYASGTVGKTTKEMIGCFSNVTFVSAEAHVSSGSSVVTSVKATHETKNGDLCFYLSFKGKKKGTAKIDYYCTYTDGTNFTTCYWSVEVNIGESLHYPYYLGIWVENMPKKTVYQVGESLDHAYMLIGYERVLENGTHDVDAFPQNAYTVSPSKFTTPGQQKVTISYSAYGANGKKQKFTCTFYVTVTGPAKRPSITKSPYGETVDIGGSCNFTAHADAWDSVTWFFVSPDGAEVKAKSAPTVHSGLHVSGYDSEKLKLSHIPASLNGWSVYATFTNAKGSTDTKKAGIIVANAPTPEPEYTSAPATAVPTAVPQFTAEPEPTSEPTAAPTPMPTPEPAAQPHQHTFDAAWSSDGEGHYRVCKICGEKEAAEEPHDFEWAITRKATKTQPGTKVGRCKVCGYVTTVTYEYQDAAAGGNNLLLIVLIAVGVLLIVAIVIGILLLKKRR